MTWKSKQSRERWRWRGGGIAKRPDEAGRTVETSAEQANGHEDKSMMSTANTTMKMQACAKLKRSISALAAAAVLAAGSVMPAFADVTNTATVNATSPDGAGVTNTSNTVAVDPIDATSSLTITKSGAYTTDADTDNEGDVGDVVTYTYTVTNTGTTALTSVDIVDTHDGTGPVPAAEFASFTTQAGSPAATPGDASITMYPGAVAVFTATYTITSGDILAAGGTGVGLAIDNDIDNSAVASGDYFDGTVTTSIPSAAALASVPLDIDATLTVAKAAYEGVPPQLLGGGTLAAADRPAGTVITYLYTITNTGNVPATNVALSDVHDGLGVFTQPNAEGATLQDNGTAGDSSNPLPGNSAYDTLAPGDVLYVSVNYTITQDDVDQRQ
jgi:large repetitive protein